MLLIIGAFAAWFFFIRTGSSDDAGSGSAPKDGTPSAVVLAWAKAMGAEDHKASCALMNKLAQEEIGAGVGDCASGMPRMTEQGAFEDAADARIIDEEVDGDVAFVTVRLGGSVVDQKMFVAKEDGTWRVSPFGVPERNAAQYAERFGPSAGAPTTSPETPGSGAKTLDTAGMNQAQICALNESIIDNAVVFYATLGKGDVTSMQQLVDAGLIAEVPPNVELGPSGFARGTGPCA